MGSKWISVFLITVLTFLESETTLENIFRRPAASHEGFEVTNYRLPKAILPKYYDISVFFKNDFSFRGVVNIDAIVHERTDEIVLHHGRMNITALKITIDGEQSDFKSADYDPITEKYTIKFERFFFEDTKIIISIAYAGDCQDGVHGLYKMAYVNKKGEKKEMAATQFQPVHARHAFPCFDEPAFKSIFKIRIQRPSEYITLSNMPLIYSDEQGSVTNDIFEESVQMSTYLVAFVVSDLKSVGNSITKVWAREDVIDQATYALQIAQMSLQYLESTFGQQYQLAKLDMVALPKTHFGGMENWGLIIYRETSILFDDVDSSFVVQQNVARLIAHECTHMWFGNFVTPDWWGFLWLSEAFANYYELKSIAEIEPEWKMDEQILLSQQYAFFIDALPSSAPMTRAVNTQSEIIDMADTITYDKGACILRMMELSFGSDIFTTAVKSYLEARKYNTGKPEDFFSRLQIQIDSRLDASVETIMNTWTKQSGYPVLSVSVSGDQVKLKQEQFFLREPNSDFSSDKKWWIPITWSSRSKYTDSVNSIQNWMYDEKIIRVHREEDDWIIFNVQSVGFYRVNYDTDSWYRIINALKSVSAQDMDFLHVLNRAAIIDDLLNLARANLLDYKIAFEGLQYLKNETSYLPFKSAFNSLDYLTWKFTSQPDFSIYMKHIFTLIKNIHQKLGFVDKRGEDKLNILLRRELNFLSCSLGLKDCIEKSLRYFNNWKNGVNRRVPKNLKQVVYTTAIKEGTKEDWDFLWNQYESTNVVSEKVEILNALSCSQDSETLNQYLRSVTSNFNGNEMHERDLSSILSSVSSCSLFGAEFTLDFVDQHYKEIVDSEGGDYEQISRILSEASKYLTTENLVDKFEVLIKSHNIDFEPIMPSLKSQLNFVKSELNWYKKNSKKIIDCLQDNNHFYASEDPSYMIPD